MNPPQDVVYSFEKIETYKKNTKREEFDADSKDLQVQKMIDEQNFEKYKMTIEQAAIESIDGTKTQQEQTFEYDTLFEEGKENQRKYDRIYSKELNWIQKESNHLDLIEYKNHYLGLNQIKIQDQKI